MCSKPTDANFELNWGVSFRHHECFIETYKKLVFFTSQERLKENVDKDNYIKPSVQIRKLKDFF